jgi:hypothetical protein
VTGTGQKPKPHSAAPGAVFLRFIDLYCCLLISISQPVAKAG